VRYLIAYDIAEPRRLQRVARLLERHALRCQKSVFLFNGEPDAVEALLEEVAQRMKLAKDVTQAWRLAGGQPPVGLIRGTPLQIYPAGVVLGPGQHLLVTHASLRGPGPDSGNRS